MTARSHWKTRDRVGTYVFTGFCGLVMVGVGAFDYWTQGIAFSHTSIFFFGVIFLVFSCTALLTRHNRE